MKYFIILFLTVAVSFTCFSQKIYLGMTKGLVIKTHADCDVEINSETIMVYKCPERKGNRDYFGFSDSITCNITGKEYPMSDFDTTLATIKKSGFTYYTTKNDDSPLLVTKGESKKCTTDFYYNEDHVFYLCYADFEGSTLTNKFTLILVKSKGIGLIINQKN